MPTGEENQSKNMHGMTARSMLPLHAPRRGADRLVWLALQSDRQQNLQVEQGSSDV